MKWIRGNEVDERLHSMCNASCCVYVLSKIYIYLEYFYVRNNLIPNKVSYHTNDLVTFWFYLIDG